MNHDALARDVARHDRGLQAVQRERTEGESFTAFVERLGKVVGALRVAPQPGHADLGPMQNQAQLAVVEAHVNDAVAKGARVVCGGQRTGQGLGFQPTVLDRCDETMRAVRDAMGLRYLS